MSDTLQFIANSAETQQAIAVIQAIFVLIGAIIATLGKRRKS